MLNDEMAGATANQPIINTLMEYFLLRRGTAAAKASPQAKSAIAALKPCATQNLISVFVIAVSICLLSAVAQTQVQTLAQTREQLLQDLESGRLRDAVLLGQQAVSR